MSAIQKKSPEEIFFQEIQGDAFGLHSISYVADAVKQKISELLIRTQVEQKIRENILAWNNKKLSLILRICKNYDDFQKILHNGKVLSFLNTYPLKLIEFLVSSCCTSVQELELLCEQRNRYIFGVNGAMSTGSKVLQEMIVEQIQTSQSEIDILRKGAEYFFQNASLVHKSEETRTQNRHVLSSFFALPEKESFESDLLKDGDFALSIYLRYGHQVDYPEIAEALIVFLQNYIAGGYSDFFSNIRIIPRHLSQGPSDELLQDTHTKFWNVEKEAFQTTLHYRSMAIFLSHSRNSGISRNIPHIISAGMTETYAKDDYWNGSSREKHVKSKIELEASHDTLGFSNTHSLGEIYAEFLKNIQDIEKKLGELMRKK